jgi:phosphoserine phosphatase
LTFVGLIGLEDPARADVPEAIRACRTAGIRVVMVTGDHAVTARSIGRAVGLGEAASRAIEGAELGRLKAGDNGQLLAAGIFARVNPEEKLELVREYQAAGEIVAMTGDGVNDAPALRQADIGVAMGGRGTDVARQAAAMILLDDAFPTIVMAVREGRVIFENIRRVAAYLLSCNASEVLVIGLAILATLPLPILPLQILYLNLVTDVFPAFALAMNEGERDVLERPPRNPKEPILGRTQFLAAAGRTVGRDGDVPDAGLRAALARLQHARSRFGVSDQRSRTQSMGVGRARPVFGAIGGAALLGAAGRYPPLDAAQLRHVDHRPRNKSGSAVGRAMDGVDLETSHPVSAPPTWPRPSFVAVPG